MPRNNRIGSHRVNTPQNVSSMLGQIGAGIGRFNNAMQQIHQARTLNPAQRHHLVRQQSTSQLRQDADALEENTRSTLDLARQCQAAVQGQGTYNGPPMNEVSASLTDLAQQWNELKESIDAER